VPFQVLWHPRIPIAAGDLAGGAIEFLGLKLRPQGARLDGFAGIVRPEAGGFIASCAVGVNELNKPKRRVLFFVNGCYNQCSLCSKITALHCKSPANTAIMHHFTPLCP
jgi:hypothetical protein